MYTHRINSKKEDKSMSQDKDIPKRPEVYPDIKHGDQETRSIGTPRPTREQATPPPKK